MQWVYDKQTGLFTVSDLTETELGITVAAIIAGIVIASDDSFRAEAARRNLINYLHGASVATSDSLLAMWIAADEFRIRNG